MDCIATKSQKFPEILQQDIHDHNIINGKCLCVTIIYLLFWATHVISLWAFDFQFYVIAMMRVATLIVTKYFSELTHVHYTYFPALTTVRDIHETPDLRRSRKLR